MRVSRPLGALLTVVLLAGCDAPPDGFVCATSAQCSGGTCESNHYCSFPDSTCLSGRRFGDAAPSGIAGVCVGGTTQQEARGVDATQCVAGTCPGGGACCNGFCCASGQGCCNGRCTNLNSVSNCGSCGALCAGSLIPACCGGTCKDLFSDSSNCGKCGVVCAPPTSCGAAFCH